MSFANSTLYTIAALTTSQMVSSTTTTTTKKHITQILFNKAKFVTQRMKKHNRKQIVIPRLINKIEEET